MAGVKTFFDTNIIVDHLAGRPQGTAAIQSVHDHHVSVITFMEVLSGCHTDEDQQQARELFGIFTVHNLSETITEQSISIRREGIPGLIQSQPKRPKLPDCIIFATSLQNQGVLYTRNTKDFHQGIDGIHIPYTNPDSAPA